MIQLLEIFAGTGQSITHTHFSLPPHKLSVIRRFLDKTEGWEEGLAGREVYRVETRPLLRAVFADFLEIVVSGSKGYRTHSFMCIDDETVSLASRIIRRNHDVTVPTHVKPPVLITVRNADYAPDELTDLLPAEFAFVWLAQYQRMEYDKLRRGLDRPMVRQMMNRVGFNLDAADKDRLAKYATSAVSI